MRTIEELWDEAAKQTHTSPFSFWGSNFQRTVTRFAETIRADCQAVPTESAEEVYDACRGIEELPLSELSMGSRAKIERIVARARTGPPKKKTPGERLKEWAIAYLKDERGTDDYDYEAEAAKLIGGNDV